MNKLVGQVAHVCACVCVLACLSVYNYVCLLIMSPDNELDGGSDLKCYLQSIK